MTTPDVPARPAKYPQGKHPNTLASLRAHAYKPGENGHGRVYPLKERLQHLLYKPYAELTEADKAKLKVGDVLALSTMEGAIARESRPLDIVWDRLDPVVNKNLLLGDITIRIVDDDDSL